MSKSETRVYTASKDCVKKAFDLFRNVNISKKRSKAQNKEEKSKKISKQCNQVCSNVKKTSTAHTLLPLYALKEMRHCLMTHDWLSLQRLFPCLLELSKDRESIIWRYAFTIILHSPMSDWNHVVNFLNKCVGCQNDNPDYVIQQLITLNDDKNKK